MRSFSAVALLFIVVIVAASASSITLQNPNASLSAPISIAPDLASEQVAVSDAPETADDGTSIETMKRILFELPEPEPELINAAATLGKAELAALLRKVWAKRQAELAEAMATFKDDAYFMKELVNKLMDPDVAKNERTVVNTLEDLEFHVAKLDNAHDFEHMGGLAAIVPLMQHESRSVRDAAAWVVGTLVKSEPSLQDAALQLGVFHVLEDGIQRDVSIVSSHQSSEGVVGPAVRSLSRALYVLSNLTSRNSKAMQLVMNSDAAVWLSALLHPTAPSQQVTKLCMRALLLLGELASHEDDNVNTATQGDNSTASIDAAGNSALAPMFVTTQLCNDALTAGNVCVQDEDGLEKALEALNKLQVVCQHRFYEADTVSAPRQPKPVSQLSELLRQAQKYLNELQAEETRTEERDEDSEARVNEIVGYITALQHSG